MSTQENSTAIPGTTPQQEQLILERTFAAPLDLVWEANTNVDFLKQWWGPAGFKMVSAELNFTAGGTFLYGMEAPAGGGIMWGRFVYKNIIPKERIEFVVSFSDESGGITRHPMAPNWPAEMMNVLTMHEEGGKTTIKIVAYPVNALPEEEAMFYGAKEAVRMGTNGTWDQLDKFLATMKAN